MPADRLLNTVLQHYQDVHDAAKTEQIIGTTTHLLTQLTNPLNLGVLTSQLLTAPALWMRDDGLKMALRVMSIYNTAAIRVRENEMATEKRKDPPEGSGMSCEAWTRAVIKGADDRSRRWQHLLVLTGVLMGMESNDRHSLSRGLKNTLEQAVLTAANMALHSRAEDGPLGSAATALALNYAFPLLSDFHKSQINGNDLLPVLIWAVTGEEGFRDGQFLHAINSEVHESSGNFLSWNVQQPSFQMLREMEARPLMTAMGPLSKVAGFAALQATDTAVVLQAQEALLFFTGRVLDAWQQTRFSAIDPAAEPSRLSPETLQTTYPALLATIKKLMFTVVSILQAITSRSLLDRHMLSDAAAAGIASRTMHILRQLFFISSRDGNNAFQVYTFTYLTSLDVLSRFPAACEQFLRETRPAENNPLPTTHLQASLYLFYLNTAEHLPLSLSADACDALIIKPAVAYLSHNGPKSPTMVELFESAHSAILSALSCPQNSPITIKMAPFYIVKLFDSFPHTISPRQFRLAFKTVMQIVSPPFPIAAMEPHLSETLLEMLRSYMAEAGTAPLAPAPQPTQEGEAPPVAEEPLSEQSSLALTLVDSLPFLPLPLVEEWLSIAAQALNEIAEPRLRQPVKKRFWDILVNGEMDVERAAIGVCWWGTKGGRELVLYGGAVDALPMMSGAIMSEEHSSRL